MYDIIGDVHGCADELYELLYKLGYFDTNSSYDRTLVFVGDLCDRGPKDIKVTEVYES